MAGQTADIRRDLTALRPMGDRVEAAGIEAGALRIADPAVEAVEDIVAAVAVAAALEAEAAVVRAEEAVVVLRMRPRHMAVVEGPIGKIVRAWARPSRALPFTDYRFLSLGNDSDSTPTKFEPILCKLLEPGAEAREIRIQLAGAEELQQS